MKYNFFLFSIIFCALICVACRNITRQDVANQTLNLKEQFDLSRSAFEELKKSIADHQKNPTEKTLVDINSLVSKIKTPLFNAAKQMVPENAAKIEQVCNDINKLLWLCQESANKSDSESEIQKAIEKIDTKLYDMSEVIEHQLKLLKKEE